MSRVGSGASGARVFDDHARTVAGLYGAQVAMLLYGIGRAEQLQVIDVAKWLTTAGRRQDPPEKP